MAKKPTLDLMLTEDEAHFLRMFIDLNQDAFREDGAYFEQEHPGFKLASLRSKIDRTRDRIAS